MRDVKDDTIADLEKRPIDNDQALSRTEEIVKKHTKNTDKDPKSEREVKVNQIQRVKEKMDSKVASEFNKKISEFDYEYDYANDEQKEEDKNVIKNGEDDVKKPEYYYYYYYDYLDPGIDISHELSDGDVERFEPLPTPLRQVGDEDIGESEDSVDIIEKFISKVYHRNPVFCVLPTRIPINPDSRILMLNINLFCIV